MGQILLSLVNLGKDFDFFDFILIQMRNHQRILSKNLLDLIDIKNLYTPT